MYQTIFLQAGGGGIGNYILIPLMFLVLYLFMIRPQMQKQKKEKKFQASIQKGTKIITTSGIHGKIVDLIDADNTCVIETGAGKTITFAQRGNSTSGKYYLVADWNNGKNGGSLIYGNQPYMATSSSGVAYLQVVKKRLQKTKRKDRVVKGMKV